MKAEEVKIKVNVKNNLKEFETNLNKLKKLLVETELYLNKINDMKLTVNIQQIESKKFWWEFWK